MSRSHIPDALPAQAQSVFKEVASFDWEGGIPIGVLLERINQVAVTLPQPEGDKGPQACRVSRTFTDRSFRHYQTIGSVDPPRKEGRRAIYGFRHFLQALMVRRLLTTGVPAYAMPRLVGANNAELQQMLLGGAAMVLRPEGRSRTVAASTRPRQAKGAQDHNAVTNWIRVEVVEGVELHMNENAVSMSAEEQEKLMREIEALLRAVCE